MGFIADPNAGPSPKIPDGGVVFNAAVADTAPVLSNTVVSTPGSTGLVLRLQCNVDGAYIVRYLDHVGRIKTLRASAAYTAASNMIELNIAGFVKEAYIEFTASAAATNLYIELWSYGRGGNF